MNDKISFTNIALLMVVACGAYILGQANTSRYELIKDNSSILIFDRKSGKLYTNSSSLTKHPALNDSDESWKPIISFKDKE